MPRSDAERMRNTRRINRRTNCETLAVRIIDSKLTKDQLEAVADAFEQSSLSTNDLHEFWMTLWKVQQNEG
jgi:hypothetical protein